jgi:2-oxoglutarate ferredoxin oxidoreductase subunit gamma
MIMEERVLMAGFGGQGIMFMGKLLAHAGMREGKWVTWLPSYGPEMRGGTANCMVTISERMIGSPYVVEPDSLIAMNRPSLEKFETSVKTGGMIVLNCSMIEDKVRREDIEVYEVQAIDIAEKLGNVRIGNMVALGAYVGAKHVVKMESLLDSLVQVLTIRHKELLDLNNLALKQGFEMVSKVSGGE